MTTARDIHALHEGGYTDAHIAQKLGIDVEHVRFELAD